MPRNWQFKPPKIGQYKAPAVEIALVRSKLANNSQSFPTAFVFRTENPNKFWKAEREAEVKFEPKVKANSVRNTILIFINARVVFSQRLIRNSNLLS